MSRITSTAVGASSASSRARGRVNVHGVFQALAVIAIVVAMAGLVNRGTFKWTSQFNQSVTPVWYCAGQAVNQHKDPYLVEPLRSCEIRNSPEASYPWVEPAPLPGYALAGFAMLAKLPFPIARTLWFYGLIAAIVLTAVMLARLARIPVPVALLCLAVLDGYFNLSYGELPPLVVAVLVAGAALGAARRYVAAAIVASLAMVEPHLGLPACLSVFVWWPRTRIPFICSGLVLAAISIAAIGVPANVEYFHTLLPLQAASEVAAQDQFSLTRVLHILGFSNGVALGAGAASYLVMVALGVTFARRVASYVESDALVALLPPAVALLGGPFVHDIQTAAAIPAAILLASSTRPPLALRVLALLPIVFAWHNDGNLRGQIGMLEIGAVAAASLVVTRTKPVAIRAGAAVAGAAVCAALAFAIETVPPEHVGPPTAIVPAAIAANDISSANWAAAVSRDRRYSTPDARDVTEKVPVWLGLVALASSGLILARTKRRADQLRPV